MARYAWDTEEFRANCYRRQLVNTATEVRVSNLLRAGSAERNKELGRRIIASAILAGIDERTAAREWVALINTPSVDDREIARLKAGWDAINPEPDTISWYNKWFCENANDFGVPYTLGYYQACLSQYEEWMAEEFISLDDLKEQFAQMERESCNQCSVYTEAARLAGVRMFAEDIPDTEHAKHANH